ncbi:phosphatase PAP2 family protein [Parvibaculum sp.]|uniref:phosphatase PAP2 family protein n=1 Tax=Parvibaculum sp. TaxID=2024848 RepID=UPI003BA90898
MENFLHDMSWVLPLRSDTATAIFNGFTFLGYTPFFLIFLPIGYWLWDRNLFTRLTVLIAITAVVNGWLKDFWQDARPDPSFQLDGDRVADSYGLPSGHAQVAVAMWFWLAYEMKRRWAWVAAVFIAAGVCFSRLYLGVHDVEDVLAGIALGLLSLAVFAALVHENVVARWRRLPAWIDFAVILVAIPLLWTIWPQGEDPTGIASVLFLLFGWFAGAALDRKAAPQAPVLPAWWLRIVMAVGGIVGLFILRAGLMSGGITIGLPEAITGYAAVTIMGLYATWIAPAIFRTLGLMKQP